MDLKQRVHQLEIQTGHVLALAERMTSEVEVLLHMWSNFMKEIKKGVANEN